MRKYYIFFLLLFSVLTVFAETTSVSGHVLGGDTNAHLPYVTISIKGTGIGTISDASGHFLLKGLKPGKTVLVAKAVGYLPAEKEITIQEGTNNTVDFEVKEDLVQLTEVVVSSNRNETNRRDASIVVGVISPKTFELTNSVCLAQGLNFQPGLRIENNCQNCGFQQVRINGLEGPYSQILIDSRPIFSALSGVYGIEQIPVNMIERVEVVRGGGSALYGSNAIAGTINVITKEPISNSFSLSHNYESTGMKANDNMLNVNVSLVSDSRKSGIYLFGSYRNREKLDVDGDGFSEVPLLQNHTIGFNSFYRLNDRSKLSFEFHNLHEFRRGGNRFDLQPHQTDITEQVEHDINGGGLNYNWYSDDYSRRLNVYSSLQHITRNSYYGAARDTAAYGNTSDLAGVIGLQYVHGFANAFFMPSDLTVGGEYQFDNMEDIQPAYGRDLKQYTKVGGLFAQNEWKSEHLSILIGARADKHNLMDKVIFSPRANVKYSLLDNLQWRGTLSTGFRAPQAFDEDLHILAVNGNVQLIKLADNLKPERSTSYSTSLDYYLNIGKVNTNFMVEGFYTDINNVFVLEKIGEDAAGNNIVERRNGAGAHVAGVNLEGKIVPSSRYRFQFGFTFQQSKYDEAEAWSDDENAPKATQILRSPNQYGYFTLTAEPFKRFTSSLSGTYTGSMQVAHFAGYIAEDELVKTPRFFDATVKLSYDFKLEKEMGLQVSTGMKNIFNSFQKDFDQGPDRDSGYMYGPTLPRSLFVSLKLTSLNF